MDKKLTGKGERIRRKMIETTARILREEGFRETTVRRIAEDAGVNIAAVRYYFGSKEELVGLALDTMMGEFENTVACLEDTSIPARERLRRYILSYVPLARKHPALFRSITRPSSAAAGDTYFVYLTLFYDRCWTRFMQNVAEWTGLSDRRDIELKSMQLIAAIEYPLILETNQAIFFADRGESPDYLLRYADLLLAYEPRQ